MNGAEDALGARRLGTSLGAYLRGQGHGDALVLGEVASCWSDVVGPEVAKHAAPRALDAGELVVRVDSPGWATHLAFLSADILTRLNDHLGRQVADRVKVTVGGRPGVE